MLKTFRENFKHLQWVLWLVIAIFIVFVFVDWGMGSNRPGTGADFAAQAGSFRITSTDFANEYRETEQRYRQLYGKNFTPDLAKAMNLPEQVVNTLVDRRLLEDEARKLKLAVTDEEVSHKVLGMKDQQGRPLFLKDGVFVGENAYRRMLAGANLSPAQFEAQTREQLLLEKLNRFYMQSVFVGDDEVQDDFAGRTVKAKIAYVVLPASPVAPGAVTDAEAEAAYKADSASYTQPEKRKAKYLLVDTQKIRQNVKATDKEIADEYNANLDSYRKGEEVHARHILYKSDGSPAQDAAAKAKAEAAIKKLKAGADFAALAKAESDDTGSKASGGDVGSFGRGKMVKEFEDAAFSAEPHAIAGPVKTPYGYHVIEVLEKSGERVQPLFEVSPSIRMRLEEKKANDLGKQTAQDLAARVAKLGSKPTDDDLRKLAIGPITFNETEFVGKSDAPAGIGYNPAFSSALFSLHLGEVAPQPVATSRGQVIVKLVEIKKPGVPPFADVKQKVVADLVKKRQDEATVAAMKKAMTPGASIEEIAKATGGKVETPDSFPKTGPVPGLGASRAVLDAAFAANPGEMKGPFFIPERGAVVFKLLEKTPFDQAAFGKEKDRIRESLRNQKSSRLISALIARRRSEMKVEINRELISRYGSA